MTQITVVYWRDIPAQVIAKAGRTTAKRELPARFAEAIDMAAMRSGAVGTDAYLADWRRGEPIAAAGDPESEVSAFAAKIEAEYDKARLIALIDNGGRNG